MKDENDLNVEILFQESLSNDNIFTITATVDTGFEWEAADECTEKINKRIRLVKKRGRIYFNIDSDQFETVHKMRSIDNIFIIGSVLKLPFTKTDKEADLELVKQLARDMHLEKYLNAWKRITGFLGKVYPNKEEYEETTKNRELLDKNVTPTTPKARKRGQNPLYTKEDDILRYRVTCERIGEHAFQSQEVAKIIGGELQDKYHWLVDLSTYHLEIFCKVDQNEVITQLRTTHESKHHRNISYFGPTTLRATICYNLLRLAHPKPGDVIIDPMCGGGSIPIEGSLVHTTSYVICADNHDKAVHRSKSNIDTSAVKCKIDLLQWSASQLPLLDSCIDVVVSDLPFGKRSGKMTDNRVLYKQFMVQLGRIVRLDTGRLVLLTYDKRSFNMALKAVGKLFRVIKILGVNIGGLSAAVYVLKRTNVNYDQFLSSKSNKLSDSLNL